MYDDLLNDLREWPRICVEYTGSIDELLDKAADAIEELQKRIPKTPHGRLVDADELTQEMRLFIKKNMLSRDDARELLETIDDAPTILEAEEGE